MVSSILEKRGRIWLQSIVCVLFLLTLFSTIVLISPSQLISFLLTVLLLWLMYDGYKWAKVVTIILLLISSVAGLFTLQELPAGHWVYLYVLATVCIHFISCLILIFSKSITEYMDVKRHQIDDFS